MRMFATLLLLALTSCLWVLDFGGSASNVDAGEVFPTPDGTWRWQWANPSPTGKSLHATGGTSASDIWVGGEGGTIAHFDGARWDQVRRSAEATRYFAIGTMKPNDVWAATDTNGKISAEHYDGTTWVESYPFAGATLNGFSHGSGGRLFAFVEWNVLELQADGTWKSTDTTENQTFGPPADIWVSDAGEAWTITTGAKLLRLPKGSEHWVLQPPLVEANAVGLSLSGAGTTACAFFTGRTSPLGGGFLRYDGASWSVGKRASAPLSVTTTTPHGSRSACYSDGSGVFIDEQGMIEATLPVAPTPRGSFNFQGEKPLGAMSLEGSVAYVVGARGAFQTRAPGASSSIERGPTTRKDLYAVDVGFDGSIFGVDAAQPIRDLGGDVLQWNEGWKKPQASGLAGPSIPVAVAVVASNDVWVATNDSSRVGVAHWTGQWGVTRFLSNGFAGAEALAIFSPGKSDVWIAGRSRCQSPPCSTPTGFIWHYDGSEWLGIDAPGEYVSVHGTGSSDVWFAGSNVAHWDGKALSVVSNVAGKFEGVWSSAEKRVWLWGAQSFLYDGQALTPIADALHAPIEWTVQGMAESASGDVFVLTKRATGTTLLWFDSTRTRLVEQFSSEMGLVAIRGRGNSLWAVGEGGATLRFGPPQLR